MYYIYIIKNKKGQIYKGSTGNLRQRISDHNTGKSDYTKRKGPWKLVYYEAFLSKKDALIEERFLKTGKGRERIKLSLKNSIYGEVPEWSNGTHC